MKEEETENEDQETTDLLIKSHGIAEKLFGAQTNVYAVEQIFDYLNGSDEKSEAEFATDFKYAIEVARTVFKSADPTPEQAFCVFRKLFDPETTLDDVMEVLKRRR